MEFGVSAYSFPFSCGFQKQEDRRAAHPMNAFGLAALASEHGLSSIAMPLPPMLPDLSLGTIDRLRDTLRDAGLTLVVDTSVVDVETLQTLLPLAKRAGARIVRATVSTILEGARAGVVGGWQPYLDDIKERIIAIRPVLESLDLVLALENHQDVTSDELLYLCGAGGPNVGVTLDVVNPLAVGEEPMAFARKLAPLIHTVHLKDYTIFPTPSGFRLVRCTLGDGVLDFPALLSLLRQYAPDPVLNIELAALYGRHIRLLEDDWWQGYPPRDVREVVPALRLMAQHARPADAPWQTPWEAGAPPDEVWRYEHEQLEQSIRYLRGLGAA